MLRALSLACLAGGAGFRPSTDSDSRSSPEALGEMGNVDFGFWALFRNLVGFNVSQSTSAQAGCSRVLGFSKILVSYIIGKVCVFIESIVASTKRPL